jgi:hypothetical protein
MNKTKNSSKKILLTAFVVIAMLLIGVISASADESDTCEVDLSSTYITFGSDLPAYHYVAYSTASPIDLTLGLRDCCVRDDVVEVRFNGCHEWTVDSCCGDWGTHTMQYKTFSLPAGSYTIELKNTISSVGPSGWYYDLSTATFTGAYPVPCLNQLPVANAGRDQIVEQTYYQGADVTLDGSGSTDDGYLWPLTYTWTWPGGSATGMNPTVSLPLGITTVTLVVNDGIVSDSDTVSITVQDTTPPVITCPPDETVEQESAAGTVVPLTATATDICDADVDITSNAPAIFPLGTTTVTFTATDDSGNSASCTTTVTVEDTTPPEISVTVSPDTLWPPDHKMVNIAATVTVSDICDAAPSVVLTSVTSDEPDNDHGKPFDPQDSTSGDGNTDDDIQADIGTEDYEFQLRAERAGTGDGRVYTITYTVTDASGNSESAIATVVVPHDMD